MRSIIYLLFFFCPFSVAFASCGDSDDIKENKKPEPISAPEPEIAIENFGVNLSVLNSVMYILVLMARTTVILRLSALTTLIRKD